MNWGLRLGLLTLAVVVAPLSGQTTLERFDRQLEQIQRNTMDLVNPAVPADRRALFDYGGYFTFNYLSLDDQNNNNHGLKQYDLVGYARFDIDDVQEFYTRGRISWRNFNPGDSFDGEGNHLDTALELAYYRLDIARARTAYGGQKVDWDGALVAGRQLVYWANGLVLSRTLDGISLGASQGPFDARMLAGITPVKSVDFDSTRPNFDDHTLRGFYGGMLTYKTETFQPFAYCLVQQDYNHGDTLVTPLQPKPIVTQFQYDSYYVGIGATGNFGDHLLYGVETVYEGGADLSNSFQTVAGVPAPIKQSTDEIRAFATDLRLEYLFNDTARTRLTEEFVFASGDKDRLNPSNTLGGNRPGNIDTSFNAFGLINTGVAFGAPVSNLIALRSGVSAFPLARTQAMSQLQVGADFFVFLKGNPSAPIDEPTRQGREFLGVEPDLFINWQVRSDVTFALRYGAFIPDTAVVFNPRTRQFLYCGVTFAF